MLPKVNTIDYSKKTSIKIGTPKPYIPFRTEEEEEPDFRNIGKNEILLGATTTDFDDNVTIPYDPNKRMTIVIVGGQGSGKTVIGKQIVLDQLYSRFNHPIFAIDPRQDWHGIVRPNNQFSEIFKKYDTKPTAYKDAEFVAPEFMDLADSFARQRKNEISMSFKDFKYMDKDTAAGILCDIFQIAIDEPAYAIVREIVQRGIERIEDVVLLIEEFAEEKKIKSERLKWKLQSMIDTQTFSNESFDYAKKMNERGIVVFEGTTADETTNEYMLQGAFVNLAIHKILSARRRRVFKKYPVIFMDEANTFCGKNGRSRGIMTSLSTKYREIGGKAGVTSVVLSQYLYEIADKIVTEADYIICPKLIEERDLALLHHRDNDVSIFNNMYYDRHNPPNEFVIFGRGGYEDYQKFIPIVCRSSMSHA